MTLFLVSPSEPPMLKLLGKSSDIPERMGSDVLWLDKAIGGTCGVQRKELNDFISSVHNGMLAKELQKMSPVRMAFLILEGRPQWTPDGQLADRFARMSRQQYRSLMRSIQARGILVEYSDDLADTVTLIEQIAAWVAKGEHRSLDRRPKPGPNEWGRVTDRGWGIHMLQSVDGIGAVQAGLIFDHFKRVPVELTASADDLLSIPGIGPKRVTALMKAFGGK